MACVGALDGDRRLDRSGFVDVEVSVERAIGRHDNRHVVAQIGDRPESWIELTSEELVERQPATRIVGPLGIADHRVLDPKQR